MPILKKPNLGIKDLSEVRDILKGIKQLMLKIKREGLRNEADALSLSKLVNRCKELMEKANIPFKSELVNKIDEATEFLKRYDHEGFQERQVEMAEEFQERLKEDAEDVREEMKADLREFIEENEEYFDRLEKQLEETSALLQEDLGVEFQDMPPVTPEQLRKLKKDLALLESGAKDAYTEMVGNKELQNTFGKVQSEMDDVYRNAGVEPPSPLRVELKPKTESFLKKEKESDLAQFAPELELTPEVKARAFDNIDFLRRHVLKGVEKGVDERKAILRLEKKMRKKFKHMTSNMPRSARVKLGKREGVFVGVLENKELRQNLLGLHRRFRAAAKKRREVQYIENNPGLLIITKMAPKLSPLEDPNDPFAT